MSTEFFNDQWRIPSNENQNKVSNYSMEFDGSSGYINCGDSNKFSFGNGTTDKPFSISAWVNMTDATRFRVVNKGADFANDYEYLFSTGGTDLLALNLYDSSTGARIARTSNTALTSYEGTWIHVVATYDGSSTSNGIKLYLNGSILVTSSNDLNPTDYTAMENTTNVLEIGAQTSESKFANGKIDQVTVFDYELSQDQVTQLGAEGYAFNFVTSNSNTISVNSTPTLTGDASLSVWIKASTNPSFAGILSSKNYSNIANSFSLQNRSGDIYFIVYTDASSNFVIGNFTPSTALIDNWNHIAIVIDTTATTAKVYFNASLALTVNLPSSSIDISDISNGLAIGAYGLNNALPANLGFFDGEMSNAQIFNTALPLTGSNSIETLYNNGKPLTNMSSFTSLQGWWKLDDTATFNSSTSVWTIPDDSSNSNNGTSVGMNASNLVASNINGELITNPMITSPKPIAYYQLGDQSVSTGPTSDYLVPNNSLSDYDFKFDANSTYTSGDNIDISGINKVLAGATSMSMTFWVYLTPAVYPNGTIFRMETFPGTIQFRFVRYGNSRGPVWMWNMNDGTNASGPGGSTSTAARPNYYNSDFLPSPAGSNTWWNLTCTWDGSTMYIYRNAVTQASRSGTYTGTIPSSTDSKAYLGSNTVPSLFMDGRISNVAFWRNYTLTQDEVSEVYNSGAPLDLNNFSGSAPAAWYKLNASEIFNNTSTEWSVDNNAYPSVYKSSLNFDGNNDTINLSNNSVFNLGTSFTISGWFNFSSNKYQGLISFDATSGGSPRGWFLFQIDTNNDIRLFDGTTVFTLKTSYTTTNKWDSFIITYDGTDLVFYINGNQESTQAVSVDLQTNGNDAQIGNNQFASGRFFDGKMSNIALWNVGLTPTQVATIYNNGTPEASISHSPVSWWKLDNTATGIEDSAGSNNGTNNGATEYAGFVNTLAGESTGMDSSNLVVSDLQQTSGYSPYALDFDGVDDYLEIPISGGSSILSGATSCTVSLWVNLDSVASGVNYTIASCFSTGDDIYLLKFKNDASLGHLWRFLIKDSTGTSHFADKTFTTQAGAWYNVIGTFDGTEVKIYVNGVIGQTTASYTGSLNTGTTSPDIIGSRLSEFFNGKISNAAYWRNTALTSAQVTEIYNQGVPSNLNTFSGTAPTAWWQLGSNSSFNTNWTCLDEIGTNNAVSAGNMTNSDIVDGPGYSASGLGTSSIDIKGDAPYSTANGLSENMDVLDRTLDTPIKNTHSLQLDGVDDYVDFGNVNIFERTDAFSGSCWVFNEGSSVNQYIISKRDTSRKGYVLYFNSVGALVFIMGPGPGSNISQVVAPAPSTNTWNHLAFTYDGSSTRAGIKLYINGALQSVSYFGQSTITGTIKVPSIPFQISGEAGITDNVLNGKIDEVAMFDSELSASQVSAIYNNGSPGNILPLNPVSWHRFESLTTNGGVVTTADSSGNGLTGTVENGASLSTVVP